MRARGDAPALHPARIPADRRDGGGRIEASRGASAVGTQHIAAPRPDPRQPERGPPVEGSSPLIHPPVAVTVACEPLRRPQEVVPRDRKSTRLNSSHGYISYAVFCLKKKNRKRWTQVTDSITTP